VALQPKAAMSTRYAFSLWRDPRRARGIDPAVVPEERFRNLFENNHTVILIVDPATRAIVDANPAAARFYGWSREELLDMAVDAITTSPPSDLAADLRLALNSPVEPRRTRHRLVDGSLRDVEIHRGPLTLAGRPLMYACIYDVTERCRAEDAQSRLMDEMRLQSAALNAASSAMVITARDGAIAWINPAFTTLTGYTFEEAIGRNPRELLKSGVHDAAFYADLWQTILSGRIWRGEMFNRRRDGTIYPETQTITPVKDATGAITHFIAIKADLSEQKRLEAQFLQSQKMEVVGRLAGGIAHDFNNLLTVINATAELAASGLHESDPLRQDLEEIGRAGQRAAALTSQLLTFSRKQILNPTVLEPGALVAGMQSMLQRLLGEDVELSVAIDEGAGSIRADRGQLEQAIMNLAVNARDAMPRGGTLALDVRPCGDDGWPSVAISVRDTGTGMDEATRQHLFEPFFTTKEPGKGTGLGLSTVYGIVRQSGGTIAVDTAPGRGTTFRLCFPRVSGASAAVEPARPTVARGTGTILVVEDEEALRRLAARILRSAGYDVLTAKDGSDALEVIERHGGPIHLMLTDVVMPGIDGVELASRAARRCPALKVLFTSGYTNDGIAHRGALDESSRFIAKPYTRAGLASRVREILDS
jgi:PAS domain S-box-containing protein